jgi:hypothetical protein
MGKKYSHKGIKTPINGTKNWALTVHVRLTCPLHKSTVCKNKLLEVILDRAPRDEIREISTWADISISTPLFARSSRWGMYIDVRTRMYHCSYDSTYIDVRTVPVRTTVVTSYQLDLDPQSWVKSYGYLGCEMISSHLESRGLLARSRQGARDERIENHLYKLCL